ncbi:hypothetical protein ACFSJ1_14080 [Trinickia caryophylli]|uniref:hypothetical protein n=1 Tax=Trinickia caryophylli TaxID=28094 RepID=UPI00363118D3
MLTTLILAMLISEYVVEAQQEMSLRRGLGMTSSEPGPREDGKSNKSAADAQSVAQAGSPPAAATTGGVPKPPAKFARSATTGMTAAEFERMASGAADEADALRAARIPRNARHDLRPGPGSHRTRPFLSGSDHSFLNKAASTVPTRRQLGKQLLRERGLDPHKMYTVTDRYPTGEDVPGGGESQVEHQMALIDILLDDQIVKAPVLFRTKPAELNDMPDLDALFEAEFDLHVEEAAVSAYHEAWHKLAAAGVHQADKSTIYSVYATDKHAREMTNMRQALGVFGRGDPGQPGTLGQILEVENGGARRFFAIVPGHRDMVISLPSDPDERDDWLKLNARLFFGDSFQRVASETDISLKPSKSNIGVKKALRRSTHEIIDEALSPLEALARGETDLEQLIHLFRDLTIPFYEVIRQLREGNYGTAVVYFGLELIPYVGAAGKRMVKVVSKGRKAWNKFGDARKLVSQVDDAENVKRLPGQQSHNLARNADEVSHSGGRHEGGMPDKPNAGGAAPRHDPKPDARRGGDGGHRRPQRQQQRQQARDAGGDEILDTPSESVRTFADGPPAPRSPQVEQDLTEITNLMNSDSVLQSHLAEPREKCAYVVGRVVSRLRSKGYQTRVRGMFLWSSPSHDVRYNMPNNHFVVLAKKGDGPEYAVDVTAGQFQKFGIDSAIIDTEEAWARKYSGATSAGVIKYKDFDNYRLANGEFGVWRAALPTDDLGEGISLLAAPAWYRNQKRTNSAQRLAGSSRRLKRRRYRLGRNRHGAS